MNENLDSQNLQGGRPEVREQPAAKKEGSPSVAPEKPKPPEVTRREQAQRELKSARAQAQEVVKPKWIEFGLDRKKRRQGLEREITNRELRELVTRAAKAIGKDKSSLDHELFHGLKIEDKDLKDPELTWVVAKAAELNGISQIPDKLLMIALEATHRGGDSRLAQEFRQRLYQQLVKLGKYDQYREVIEDIFTRTKDYPRQAIGWYGAPDKQGEYDGALQKEVVREIAEKGATAESLGKVLQVETEEEVVSIETAERTVAQAIKDNNPLVKELLAGELKVPSDPTVLRLLHTALTNPESVSNEQQLIRIIEQIQAVAGETSKEEQPAFRLLLAKLGRRLALLLLKRLGLDKEDEELTTLQQQQKKASLNNLLNLILGEITTEQFGWTVEKGRPFMAGAANDQGEPKAVIDEQSKEYGDLVPEVHQIVQNANDRLRYAPDSYSDYIAIAVADLELLQQNGVISREDKQRILKLLYAQVEELPAVEEEPVVPAAAPEVKITDEIEAIIASSPDRAQDTKWLQDQRDKVVGARLRGEITEEEETDSLAELNKHIKEIRQAQEKERQRIVAERSILPGQLLSEDIYNIRENPKEWIREMLYELEKEPHSTHESELRGLVQKIYTARDLIKLKGTGFFFQQMDEDQLVKKKEEIGREIHARIHLHDMRRAMGTIDWQKIVDEALHLGTHGLFHGFSVMDASRAFNRFQFLIERKRIVYKDGKYDIQRITPTVVNELRKEVEKELLFEFERLERDKIINSDGEQAVRKRIQEIKASVQLGYNLFVATQRQALHVSWGEMFERDIKDGKEVRTARGKTQWLSDPDTHIAALFAFLEFSVEKWEIMSRAERQVLESIMVYAGEGDRELGRRRMNRILKIKDFFSSGWRHDWIYENTDKRYREENAENFLLGMRLRKTGDEYKRTSRENKGEWEESRAKYRKNWEKVRIYRPLELVKHLREEREVADLLQLDTFKVVENGEEKQIGSYVELEQYLGKYVYPIYEKVYRERPRDNKRHIRWDKLDRRNLDPIDPMNDENLVYTTIESMVEDSGQARQVADQAVSMMQALQRIGLTKDAGVLDRLDKGDVSINDPLVVKLIEDTKYEDLAEWTLFLDDAIIADWEKEIEIKDDKGNIVETVRRVSSEMWLEEEGGRSDPLPRILGDMHKASTAAQGMLGVAQSKTVEEFNENMRKIASADAMRGYAGGDTPEVIAIFGGGWLNMAKAYGIYNWLGLSGISIKSTSELQRLFGREAESLNTRELKNTVELLYKIMGDLDLVGPEGKKLGTKLKESLGATDFMLFLFQTRPFFAVFLVALAKEIEEMLDKD